MSEDSMLMCLIAFILGFLVQSMIRGNGLVSEPGVDLSGGLFIGANLNNVHLEGANLRDAFFIGANLNNAHLEGAVLRGADLSNANLYEADLTGARLRGSWFTRCQFRWCQFRRCHLFIGNSFR